jgi:F-type H+-transporting ATPase subunit alpha
MPIEKQVAIIYAVTNGYLDDIPVDKIKTFENGLHKFMEATYPSVLSTISARKELDSQTEETLKKALKEFKQGYSV